MEHHDSTAFGVSKECYGIRMSTLTRGGQRNVVSVNIYSDSSFMILKDIEKENLRFFIKSLLTTKVVQKL